MKAHTNFNKPVVGREDARARVASSVSLRRVDALSVAMGRESKPADVITREYTINLGKAITGVTFKKRAPRAVAAVREP